MSKVKSKFTLHIRYKDFVPGKDRRALPIEMLSPHVTSLSGCLALLFATLVMLSAGLCFGLAFLWSVADQRYASEGQDITATIVACGLKSGSTDSIEITYTYTVANHLMTSSSTKSGVCLDYPLGTALQVQYLISEPSQSRIGHGFNSSVSVGSMLLFGGVVIFCVGMMFWGIRDMRRYLYARSKHRLLATNGMLLEGEITAINGHKPYKHDAYYVRVWYSFETPRKKVLKGFAEAHRQDLKDKLPPVGTPVTVLYADDGGHMML